MGWHSLSGLSSAGVGGLWRRNNLNLNRAATRSWAPHVCLSEKSEPSSYFTTRHGPYGSLCVAFPLLGSVDSGFTVTGFDRNLEGLSFHQKCLPVFSRLSTEPG